MKVLCIGSAVMDIAATPIEDSVNWKEKQRISDIRILPGGDAVNQSIHLAVFGWIRHYVHAQEMTAPARC